MGLHLGCRQVGRARDRAGRAPLIIDADLTFDPGGVEGISQDGGYEGGADREADCGACHDEEAVS
jgi:hypothetical protein